MHHHLLQHGTLMSAEQALKIYHSTFNNVTYKGFTLALQPLVDDATYTRLANLFIDTALEAAGYPGYNGAGWKFAYELQQIALSVPDHQMLMNRAQEHLMRFSQAHESFFDTFDNNPQAITAYLTSSETTTHLSDQAVQTSSDLPQWQGRTTHYLLVAADALLQAATISVNPQGCPADKLDAQPSDHALAYLAEKVRHGINHLINAIQEITKTAPGSLVLIQRQLKKLE